MSSEEIAQRPCSQRDWPAYARTKWPEARFAEDGSGATCTVCSLRDGDETVFITTHNRYALHHWKRHAASGRHENALRVAEEEKGRKPKKPRLPCEGVIPNPERMEILTRMLLYQKYSSISSKVLYEFGTTAEGYPTLFSKECSNKTLKRKNGYVCDECNEIRAKKYKEIFKGIKKAAEKYSSSLKALRQTYLNEEELGHLKSVMSTASRYLSVDGKKLKKQCHEAVAQHQSEASTDARRNDANDEKNTVVSDELGRI